LESPPLGLVNKLDVDTGDILGDGDLEINDEIGIGSIAKTLSDGLR
jgi:hypothetical protein